MEDPNSLGEEQDSFWNSYKQGESYSTRGWNGNNFADKKFYNYVDSGNCFSKLFFSLLNTKNNLSWPKICMQIKKICSTLYR